MAYTPGIVPRNVNDLVRFLEDELQNIRFAINALEAGHLDKTNVAPTKPVEGDVRYTSGASWDPGYGKGLYYFDGTSWVSVIDRDNDTWD